MERPIGVFDSGVGGLTVCSQIRNYLPDEQIIYFGDTAHLPYGTKSKSQIVRFSSAAAKFLTNLGIKLLVVACNSSSAVALASLKKRINLPIIGVIDPGVEEAVRATSNKHIGVIGTRATIESGAYQGRIARLDPEASVVAKACPLFVPLVEEGRTSDEVMWLVAREYLEPIRDEGIDTLILGCTHYPLLNDIIARVMGKEVKLIDSAQAVAIQVKEILDRRQMLTSPGRKRASKRASSRSKAGMKFYVSDWPENFKELGKRFLGEEIRFVKEVRLDV